MWSIFRIGVFSNPIIWLGIGTVGALQLLYTYFPLMNRLFESAPMSAAQWVRVFAVGFVAHLIVGFEKWVRRSVWRANARAAPGDRTERRISTG